MRNLSMPVSASLMPERATRFAAAQPCTAFSHLAPVLQVVARGLCHAAMLSGVNTLPYIIAS